MHGQEIASELAKRRGEKPSPGTIYPALKSLKDAGFITEVKEGKTIYRLTPRGEKALELAKKRLTRTFFGVIRRNQSLVLRTYVYGSSKRKQN